MIDFAAAFTQRRRSALNPPVASVWVSACMEFLLPFTNESDGTMLRPLLD
jgi:hypothetical protein